MIERFPELKEFGRLRSLGRSVRRLLGLESPTRMNYLESVQNNSSLTIDAGVLHEKRKDIEINMPDFVLLRPEIDRLNAAGLFLSLVVAATKIVQEKCGPNARDDFFVSIWDGGDHEELIRLDITPADSSMSLDGCRYVLTAFGQLERYGTVREITDEFHGYGQRPDFSHADIKAFTAQLDGSLAFASRVYIGFSEKPQNL